MKSTPLGKEPPKLVSQAELGRLLGVTRKTISDWAGKKSFPVADPTAKEARYSVHDVSIWIEVEHKRRLIHRSDGDLSEADPLLAGDGSPALERYREERAKMAMLDRKTREGQLVVRSTVKEAWGRVASVLRSVGRALQQGWGFEASRVLDDGLKEAEREVNQVCGGDRDLYTNT